MNESTSLLSRSGLKMCLCDSVLELNGQHEKRRCDLPRHYEAFLTPHASHTTRCSIRISSSFGPVSSSPGEHIFDSDHFWKVYRLRDEYRFETVPRLARRDARRCDRVIRCHRDYGVVHVTRDPDLLESEFTYPLNDGMDRILLASALTYHGLGFLVHSCGVFDGTHGMLFVGRRGAGKTTMARLWLEANAGIVGSDECMGIVRSGPTWNMHGTPWPSKARCASNTAAPLSAIFFLEHGTANTWHGLSAGEALTRLMAQVVVPWWDALAIEHAVNLARNVCLTTPAVLLRSRPNQSAIATIRSAVAAIT